MTSLPLLPSRVISFAAYVAVATFLAGSAGCAKRSADAAPTSSPTAEQDIRLDAHSPKLAFLGCSTVGTGAERVVATLPAQVAMDEDHTVRITSPVVGRVTALLAHPGDHVARGQVLARVASGDLAQAASDLVKAEASARQAKEALKRSQDLYDHGVLALKDLEQARTDDAQAEAEQDRARLRAKQLGANEPGVEGDYIVRAPFAGTIVDRSANPGGEVRNDNGQVLFTLSSLDTVWIVASAYEHDLPNVRSGNLLQFSTESVPGRAFDARVLRVSRALDTQTHTATITAAVPNPGGVLLPQVFGQASVMAPNQDRNPVVPTEALVTQGTGAVVFVEAEPGHFVRRPVTVGQDDGVTAVITNGLKVGERVVTRGSLLLAGEMVR
jgi:cobalt-zinc-cadmium efflux system membrane fusion protein